MDYGSFSLFCYFLDSLIITQFLTPSWVSDFNAYSPLIKKNMILDGLMSTNHALSHWKDYFRGLEYNSVRVDASDIDLCHDSTYSLVMNSYRLE